MCVLCLVVCLCVLECMCGCASISVCLHLCVDLIVSTLCLCVSCYIHVWVIVFDGAIVCVAVCVCDIRLLCYGDVTAMVCIPCKCVCVGTAPLPSYPHECVSEVHVIGVVSCVGCVSEGVWW